MIKVSSRKPHLKDLKLVIQSTTLHVAVNGSKAHLPWRLIAGGDKSTSEVNMGCYSAVIAGVIIKLGQLGKFTWKTNDLELNLR
ncbi:hypothetical protein DKX38_018070 [Salix brachista]|uniref:Uncharacterized protein n=1 Tax=Salix brachista TaxID=2182728 RepID=A0A5N5KX14_9ROSI|nr:hypothetical protein DKX38_018070 [Salix brachista]